MIKLIPGWRTWWRWWSLRLESLGMLLALLPTLYDSILLTWTSIPHDIKQTIPDEYIQTIGAVVFTAGVLARFVPQRKPTEAADADRAKEQLKSAQSKADDRV